MIKIEIKNRFTGLILLNIQKENNTIKETVEEAVKAKINLNGVSLNGASLDGASLNDASLNGVNKLPIHCKWTHGITDGKIHIGCEKRTIDAWELFFDSDEVIETKRNKPEFKQIQAVYEAYKAYLTFLNKSK